MTLPDWMATKLRRMSVCFVTRMVVRSAALSKVMTSPTAMEMSATEEKTSQILRIVSNTCYRRTELTYVVAVIAFSRSMYELKMIRTKPT